MNDVNEKCWNWCGEIYKVGDWIPFSEFNVKSLECALDDYKHRSTYLNNIPNDSNNRVYKIIKHRVTQVLTIQEARRLLKLNNL
jgi:hypothetical protein